jgi:predicted phage-related endonuclease
MALSPKDLAIRSTALWSTEAAACLGLSKYGTPVSVWMEKVGQRAEADSDDVDEEDAAAEEVTQTEAMYWGLALQPAIARRYSEITGEPLDSLEGVTIFSDEHPWMASHFDYRLSNNRRKLVECKSFYPSRRIEFGDEGSDDVPMDCLVQCLHEGYIAKADVVDLAVLFGGQKFEIFTVPVRQDAVDMLIDKLHAFWQHVEKREPPTPQTDEEVKALWQRDNGREVIATPEVERACAQLAQIKENLKAGKEAKESLDVLIKNAIGEAAALRSADRSRILATWKNSKDKLSFNKTQFAIDNPSLYERYTSMAPGSRRFLLK